MRALAAVLAVWIGVRTVILWPVASPVSERFATRIPATPTVGNGIAFAQTLPEPHEALPTIKPAKFVPLLPVGQPTKTDQLRFVLASQTANTLDQTVEHTAVPVFMPAAVKALPVTEPSRARVAVSGWLLVRPETSGAQLATAGQLGGSQIGIRAAYPVFDVTPRTRIAVSGRLSSGFQRPFTAEGAVGLAIKRQGRVSSEVIVEHRFALLDGGRNAIAVIGAVGASDIKLAPRVAAQTYVQGGVVGITARDAFADGALRIDYDLSRGDKAQLSAGGALWAAAQPGVTRVDIGPHITVRPRLGNASLRISAEWRFRVGGNARPASGPSLSAGFDF
jgi:hypothetical protein